MIWTTYVTTVIAVAGFTLSAVMLMLRMRDDRVRLKVIPKLAFRITNGILSSTSRGNLEKYMQQFGVPNVAIEVVNLSKFAVIISDVGICEGRLQGPTRAALTIPLLPNGDKWPKRLEPRESMTAHFDVSVSHDYQFTPWTRVYATTSCDVSVTGTSDALKAWAEVYGTYTAWMTNAQAAE